METPQHIKDILTRLPKKPGVYRHYDKDGKLLYVGKAKDLKSRVSSYFNKQKYENRKTQLLVSKIADIQFMVVDTELDALLLENSLIKKHQPRWNIALKDDKTYPWIVIKKERFPRVFPTRQKLKDGAEYYGPYANVKLMRAVLGLVQKLYPLRTCKYNLSEENVDGGKFRVCLEYHIGNCLAPCVGKMSEDQYNANIHAIRQVIKGNLTDLVREMKAQMQFHAERMQFEEAEVAKKRVEVLQNFQAKSTIVNPSIHNVDVVSVVSDPKSGYVNYIKINNGTIVQSQTIELKKNLEETDQELLVHGMLLLRDKFQSESTEIYLPFELDFELPGVKFHIPQRGDKAKLMELSERNASYFMKDKHKQEAMVDPDANANRILETLKKDLHLNEMPVHIECFDNSNIQGTNPASACVVFKDAKPSKKDYRKFNIKTVEGPDDYASMEEVVHRRYKRLRDESESLPQLVIIDGGKGQLSSAMKALDRLGMRGEMVVIGIAKRLEEIYFPGDQFPLYIDKRSESLKLIQHLRNEAHRFSLKHHRDRRSKEAVKTELADIQGVGFRTIQELLWKFKTVNNIRDASIKQLEEVVDKRKAKSIYDYFNKSI